MWIDNASQVDMLSYRPYAQLITSIITNKRMNPLTIGLFGSWGVGKSTLLNLIGSEIQKLKTEEKVQVVSLNAWMFEGYDDAKTALMEDLLHSIDEDSFTTQCKTKLLGLLKRIDYFRLAKTAVKRGVPMAMSMATGNPIPLLMNLSSEWPDKLKTKEGVDELAGIGKSIKENYIKDRDENNITENVRVFRGEFAKFLEEWGVNNLVIMIDDLDRCTPDRIIETLEAIKLFLSVPRTTFIIAVDERIVTYAIKNKYPVINEDSTDISKDYIEKIIQLPIRLPELSPIYIQNYLLLLTYELFLEDNFKGVLEKIYDEGSLFEERVLSTEYINSKLDGLTYNHERLEELSNVVEQIGGVVATALKGNPRQAKRFLNSFLVRKQMADICFKGDNKIENEVLAKLMALEYMDLDLFKELNKWYKQSTDIIPELKELCDLIEKDKILEGKYAKWNDNRIKKWVLCEPTNLFEKNLDKYFYLTRDVLLEEVNTIEALTGNEKDILINLVQYKDDVVGCKSVIAQIIGFDKDSQRKIIKAIFSLYDNKRIGLNVLSILFTQIEEIQFDILERVKKLQSRDVKVATYAYIKLIFDTNQEIVKSVIQELISSNVLKAKTLSEMNVII